MRYSHAESDWFRCFWLFGRLLWSELHLRWLIFGCQLTKGKYMCTTQKSLFPHICDCSFSHMNKYTCRTYTQVTFSFGFCLVELIIVLYKFGIQLSKFSIRHFTQLLKLENCLEEVKETTTVEAAIRCFVVNDQISTLVGCLQVASRSRNWHYLSFRYFGKYDKSENQFLCVVHIKFLTDL